VEQPCGNFAEVCYHGSNVTNAEKCLKVLLEFPIICSKREKKNKQQQQQKTVLRAVLQISEYLPEISKEKHAYSLICGISGMKK